MCSTSKVKVEDDSKLMSFRKQILNYKPLYVILFQVSNYFFCPEICMDRATQNSPISEVMLRK